MHARMDVVVGRAALRFRQSVLDRHIGGGVASMIVDELGLTALGFYLAVALDLCDQFQNNRWRYRHAVVVQYQTVILTTLGRLG
ncbi:hypothetical protein D3C77_742640 [compost metagenome]